jgi:two-component system phosphate regulon sensor histidine kinase PhoR
MNDESRFIVHHSLQGENVRRGTVILLLCVLMLGGGVGVLGFAPMDRIPLPAWRSSHETSPGIAANRLGALVLFLCAGATGLLGMVALRRTWHNLALHLHDIARQDELPREIASTHPDLACVVAGINSVIEAARQSVARAELQRKELAIQLKLATAEREHLEAIIYSISDAVLVTDPFDEVVLANDSAMRMMNARCASHYARPDSPLLIDDSSFPPELRKLIRDMRQSDSRGGRRIVEFKAPSPTGDRIYKVTLSCVSNTRDEGARTNDGSSAGSAVSQPAAPSVVAVLHDMTREREVAKVKNDFVSNVSHELRTPLASIKAYAEMLIDGEAADAKTSQEFYEVIHNEANRLGRLIDNILNISRIESGVIKVNKQPQSLLMILKEAIEVISPQAKQKKITIEEQISPAFYQTLIDRDMLYETCLNLLSNAVKYTPESGRITVQTLVDESRKIVTVRVSDTGVGIPPKDLPFIFDKFYRSDANSNMAKGTGLGLSLVKHIIETVHHGRLFVESHVGQGSTFGFELELS